MKATMLAESSLYLIFSLGYLCYRDVYRHESGRCRTPPFFLNFLWFHLSRFSFYINLNTQSAMAFTLETRVRYPRNACMGTSPLGQSWILTYWYQNPTAPISGMLVICKLVDTTHSVTTTSSWLRLSQPALSKLDLLLKTLLNISLPSSSVSNNRPQPS